MKRVEDKEKKKGEHSIRVTRGKLFSVFLKAGLAFGGGLGGLLLKWLL